MFFQKRNINSATNEEIQSNVKYKPWVAKGIEKLIAI